MKILIIVPAYNEERNIEAVVNDLKQRGYQNILVVDDGSSDRTGALAKKAGAKTVRHIINRGLGAALGTGLAYAAKYEYDLAVTFDADGQHQARDLKKLLAPIKSGRADVVIGSRFLGEWERMPKDRVILNWLSNIMTWCFYGQGGSDSQSGLRAFNQKAIAQIRIETDRMEVASEFYREFKRLNLKVQEVPIKAIYDQGHLSGSKQENWAAVKLPLRLFWRLFR